MVSAGGRPPKKSRPKPQAESVDPKASFQSLLETLAAEAKRGNLLPEAEKASSSIHVSTQEHGWHLSLSCHPLVLLQRLTALERRVARFAVKEMTYKEIVKETKLKLGTVKSYLGKIRRKFGVRTRVGLTRFYTLLSQEQVAGEKEGEKKSDEERP